MGKLIVYEKERENCSQRKIERSGTNNVRVRLKRRVTERSGKVAQMV